MDNQKNEILLAASNEAIFISENNTIISFNNYAGTLFGYKAEELKGMNVGRLFSEKADFDYANLNNEGTLTPAEVKAVKSNGDVFCSQVFSKKIPRHNDTLVSYTIRDISDQKKTERVLLGKDALLESLSFTAARFLESKSWNDEIEEVLKHIGASANVSRVYIFQNFEDENDRTYMCQQYEWVAENIEPQIENQLLKKLYYHENGLQRLLNEMSAGNVIQGLVKEFPEQEREVLESQNIRSIFLTPIFQYDYWWGFIGYDECRYERKWNFHEKQLLKTVADLFTAALERQKIEQRLTKTNENFVSLFNNSPDGIFVYDYEGYLLDTNEAGCRLHGLPVNEMINKHVSALVPENEKEKIIRDFKKWTTGELKFLESSSVDHDGKSIPVEIRSALITYYDKPAVLLLVRDISRRKNSELLLKKRIEFIQFISQISSEFIKIDLSNIQDALNNALRFVCRFTGVERGYVFQINASKSSMLLTNEYCDPAFREHKGILDSFPVAEFEDFIATLQNGDYIVSHADEIPATEENAAMLHILEMLEIKSFINIPLIVGEHFLGYIGFDSTTEKTHWDNETINAFMLTGQIIANTIIRKKSEDEIIEAKNKAEQSDRLKTAFLGQMSHEMRTPLNSIMGFAEILEKELQGSDLHEMAEYILAGGDRLLNTFNLIIDLSEIESNIMQAQLVNIDLNEILKNMVPLFSRKARDKNLEVKVEYRHPSIIINCDDNLLEKIIYNLADNALKYTMEGSITFITDIEEFAEKQYAILKVKDTGIGINEEKIEDIFNKFRQASEGYNREFEGAGLGLSVTKGMVELLDGEIFVYSVPGKGSEFKIRFPLIPGKFTSDNTGIEIQTGEPVVQTQNILVIEDEVVHQKYIDYILKQDYKITFAENGLKGLELARNEKFNLIIMDINLGKDMNGMETLLNIRQLDGYENIPVIAATANVMKGEKERFLKTGFTHYLAKPYKSTEMKTLVDSILQPKIK